jgi:hypothetical protein
MPINDVAKELGICATMLKKICRRNGIPRWPHRKIRSINKMIENLEASLENNTSEAEDCIKQEINILKNKKTLIMKNPSILGGSSKRIRSGPTDLTIEKPVKRVKVEQNIPVMTKVSSGSSTTITSTPSSLSINQLLTQPSLFTPREGREEPKVTNSSERPPQAPPLQHTAQAYYPSHSYHYPSKYLTSYSPQQQIPASPSTEYTQRSQLPYIPPPSYHNTHDLYPLPKIHSSPYAPPHHPSTQLAHHLQQQMQQQQYKPVLPYFSQHPEHYLAPPPMPHQTQPRMVLRWVMEYDSKSTP